MNARRRPMHVGVASEAELVAAGIASLLAPHAGRLVVRGDVDLDDRSTMAGLDVLAVEITGRFDSLEPVLRRIVDAAVVGCVALLAPSFPASMVRRGRAVGARAFLAMDLPAHDLADALVDAADGKLVLATRPTGTSAAGWWPGIDAGLSARESQVLALCADGLTNREIAEALFLSTDTVKSHLQRAYRRIGLRNRAQAAAYVHQELGAGGYDRPAPSPVGQPARTPERASTVPPSGDAGRALVEVLGLDDDAIAARRALLGIDDAMRSRLAGFEHAVRARAARASHLLVERWRATEHTAHLVRDDAVRDRLVEHQHAYLLRLFVGEHDTRHIESVLRIGAGHHRLRLAPQWYLASCGLLVCDQLDTLWAGSRDDAEAVEATIALLASVLFDAGLVLDAYEMSLRDDLVHRSEEVDDAPVAASRAETAAARTPTGSSPSARRPLSRIDVPDDEAAERRAFLALGRAEVDALRGMHPAVLAAVPDVLRAFYDLVRRVDSVVTLVADDAVVERLLDRVGAYWSELLTSEFGHAHAASRVRVGVIHERIALTPQFYLAGLAQQVSGVLRALVRPGASVRTEVDALLRAVFYDVTYVLDAYMGARAAALLQVSRFAGQVVMGLANGIAIVDARDRVEYANEELLELAGVPAGVLHRLPVESALPLHDIAARVHEARTGPKGRSTALYDAWGRRVRVTAVRLQRSMTGRDGLVAVVVDDITDVLRASAELDRDGRRLAQVLDAVDVVVWEAHRDDLTVLAVSRGTSTVLGIADTDLLGTRGLVELVHPDDRETFLEVCRDASVDGHTALVHRIRRPGGEVRTVRSSIVALAAVDGPASVSGVTVDVTDLRPVTPGTR